MTSPEKKENDGVVKNNITEELDTQEEKFMLARNLALPSFQPRVNSARHHVRMSVNLAPDSKAPAVME